MLNHGFDLIGIENGQHDRVTSAGEIRDAECRFSAQSLKAPDFGRLYVIADYAQSAADQANGQSLAHQTYADKSYCRCLVRHGEISVILTNPPTASFWAAAVAGVNRTKDGAGKLLPSHNKAWTSPSSDSSS